MFFVCSWYLIHVPSFFNWSVKKIYKNLSIIDTDTVERQGFGAGGEVFGWSRSRHLARLRLQLKF